MRGKYRGRFEQAAQKKPRRGKKILLIILAILLVIVIGAIIAGVMVYNSMLNKITKVDVPKINYTQATEVTEATGETQPTDFTVEVTTEPPHVASSEDYVNILVVGQSGRKGEDSRMADTMILLTLNTHENTLTMTSMLRDAFVKMPNFRGHEGGRIKLTTIYHLGSYYSDGDVAGSMELINQTLYDNFGIEVDHNFEVDFNIFIDAIDLMGGVSVYLRQEECDYLNAQDAWVAYDTTPGWFHLDGSGALCYARMRKAEGDNDSDIKRTDRQRHLIASLITHASQKSLSELQAIANEILPMVVTSMSNSEITELLMTMLPKIGELKVDGGGTCPAEYKGEMVDIYKNGEYHSVLRFDVATNTKIMRAITEGEGVVETKPATEPTT